MDPGLVDQLGPYRTLHEIARGGMGVVYRAEHAQSGAPVALKVILDVASDLELLERFRREVTLVRALEHPHLVRVLDADLASPRPWAAFELVSGGTLRDRVEPDGPLPWPEATELITQLAAGVAAAHAQGLIHRDIKPSNVLLGPSGAKLADFGLVKDLTRESLTQTGTTLGTPGFLAPEQVGGTKHAIGPTTDVYGLAATLYFALSGREPFAKASTVATLNAVLYDPPSPLRTERPDVPAWLEATCLRGLAKQGAERFPSASAFTDALRPRTEGPKLAIPLAVAALLALLSTAGVARLVFAPSPTQTSTQPAQPKGFSPAARAALAASLAAIGSALHDAQPAHALVSYDYALKLQPKLASTFAARAALHTRGRHADRALSDLDAALALHPDDPSLHARRAWALVALRRFDEAITACDRALELRDDVLPALHARAFARAYRLELDAAEADFDRALELSPETAALYRDRAYVFLRRGRHDRSLADLNAAIERDPNDAQCYALRAEYQWNSQSWVQDCERALELDPSNALAHAQRAEVEIAIGQFDVGLRSLERALELDPNLIHAYLRRAQLYHERLKSPARALPDYDRAVELNPLDPDPLRQRARYWDQRGKTDRAMQDLNQAVALPHREADTFAMRGVLRMQRKQLPEALSDLDTAIELNPNQVGFYQHRALVKAALKHFPEALSDIDSALKNGPQLDEREDLEALRVQIQELQKRER